MKSDTGLTNKITHPGKERHPSKDGIQIKNRFEVQLKLKG